MSEEYERLTFDREGPVATLVLRRPDRLNALSVALVTELHAALDSLDADVSTRVVVITGAGNGFCAGTDIKERPYDNWPEPIGQVQSRYRLQQCVASLVVRMREIPQPLVAAMHGPAAGGGMSLAAACDMRIADETARFNAAFVRIGASGGDIGSSWLLPRLVGPEHAARILYTGRFVDADEALRIGLVSQVVPAGGHLAAAHELAGEIVQNSPLGIRMTKELLNASLDAPAMRSHLELENRSQILCSLTGDFAEGMAAFAERRDASYTDH